MCRFGLPDPYAQLCDGPTAAFAPRVRNKYKSVEHSCTSGGQVLTCRLTTTLLLNLYQS